MNELDLFMIIFVNIIVTIIFVFFTFLGKNEIKIKLFKMIGRFKGRIIAKEIRKDGVIYTFMPKIQNNKVKLGKRTYNYNIKKTCINRFNIREAYFSEILGSQLNPYEEQQSGYISPEDVTDMLEMATAMGMLPKPMFDLKNIPWLMIIIGLIVIVALASGVVKI
jgi:hypothetical protein